MFKLNLNDPDVSIAVLTLLLALAATCEDGYGARCGNLLRPQRSEIGTSLGSSPMNSKRGTTPSSVVTESVQESKSDFVGLSGLTLSPP